MTSIIMALYNQLDCTQTCLESIEAYTPEEHEIIFIDNGSTDGTREWIEEVVSKNPKCKLIINDENLGAAAATNQGIIASEGDYICFINNDVVVSKEWLKGLIECVESAPDIGMVGAKSNYVSGPQIATGSEGYDSLLKYQVFAENYRKAFRGCYIPYWRIVPFCGLIKREPLKKVGLFDERFFPGNFTDDDMCLRLCLLGYRNLICGDVFIHHFGSQSFKGIDYGKNIEECQKKFDAKWKQYPTISACLIVKDESMNIGACLSTVYPFVDEIIVVDTGSKDRTKEIAKDAGEKVKVYDFEWVDDFAAARNYADSKATKDWILSLDADEIIDGLDVLKKRIRPYHAYRIVTRNYTMNPLFTNVTYNKGESAMEVGVGWFPSTKIRLYPRDQRIYWEYPVHEVVENSVYHLGMGIVEPNECFVHHYGRMDNEYDDKHGEKYYNLLHKQYESGKNDLRSLEQLAIQAQGLKRYEEAKKFWHEVIKLDPTGSLAPCNLCHCFAEEGDWPTALIWGELAYKYAPESKDTANNLAMCLFRTGNYDRSIKMCEDLLVKHPDHPLIRGILNAARIKQSEVKDGNESLCGTGS